MWRHHVRDGINKPRGSGHAIPHRTGPELDWHSRDPPTTEVEEDGRWTPLSTNGFTIAAVTDDVPWSIDRSTTTRSPVARDNLSKSDYLAPALRPLRSSRTIDASPAGANSPEGKLVFPTPPRPIPGELPVP